MKIEEQDDGRSGGRRIRRWPGLLVTAAGAIVVVALTWGLLSAHTYRPSSGAQVAKSLGSAVVDGKAIRHVALQFSFYPFANGTVGGVPIHPHGNWTWPTIGPTSDFQVPAHTLVTVTVRQYDGGATITDPWFATVRGTVGDVATVDGRVVHGIDPTSIGHTFLLRSLPGLSPTFLVNVPFPAVADHWSDQGPSHVTVFSFVSGPKGTYAWNCEFPCGQMVAMGGAAMSTNGYMSGYLHVV